MESRCGRSDGGRPRSAEKPLEDSLAALSGLIESLPDAVLVVEGEDHRIRYANRAVAELLGYDQRELLDSTIDVLYPEVAGANPFVEALSEAIAAGESRFGGEQVLVKKSGDLIWTELAAMLVNGAAQGSSVVGIIRDATAGKLTEEALLQSHARLELLKKISIGFLTGTAPKDVIELAVSRLRDHFPNMRLAYSEVQRDGAINLIHAFEPEWVERARGLEADLGATSDYLESLHEETPLIVQDVSTDPRIEGFRDVLRAHGVGAIVDVPVRHSGELLGVLGVDAPSPRRWSIHNVTTLTEVAAHLAIALADARAQEHRARLEAELRQSQKMEAVGRLAGGVAHDFNNLLTGITGYAQLVLQEVDAAPVREDVTNILELARRGARLTRQLLAFSRRQTLQPTEIDLNELITDTTKMIRRLIGEDIDLRFVPSPETARIRADPGQIEQVLMNLAVNSRDAMPDGGTLRIGTGLIEARQEDADAHPGVPGGSYVAVSVCDTGCGIEPEVLEHIFEPFYTTKEASKGTGLGLSTVYGIVQQHGGSIHVESKPGSGSTFRIYLPRLG